MYVYQLVLFSLYGAMFLVTLPIYIFRLEYEPIRSRGRSLSISSAIGGFIYFVFSCLPASFQDEEEISCHYVVWPASIFLPSFAFPVLLRGYVLFKNYEEQQRLHLVVKNEEFSATFREKFRMSLTSKRIFLFYLFNIVFFLILAIIIQFSFPFNHAEFTFPNVDCFPRTIYLIAVEAGLCVLGMVACVVLLWNCTDSFHFKTELILLLIVSVPIFVIWILYRLTSLIPGNFDSDLFVWLVIILFHIISIIYPLWLSFSDRWLKISQKFLRSSRSGSSLNASISIQRMTSEEIFNVVLTVPDLMDSFRTFCVRTWCVENLLFYQEVQAFKDTDPANRASKAAFMVKMFVANSAPYQINIDSGTRLTLIERVKSSDVDGSIFDDARRLVYDQMKQDSFEKWRKTSDFHHLWKKSGLKSARGSRVLHEEPSLDAHDSVSLGEMRQSNGNFLNQETF